MLAPFNHGDPRQIAFENPLMPGCDLFLAITGPYWFRTIGQSLVAHWQPKMIHVDMAVRRADYAPLERSFGPPGKRRVLYIGHSGRGKNTPYLSQIAALMPDVEFAWVGRGARPIEGLKALGFIDYDSPAGRSLLAEYDIFLTVGNADSNPTTILESMAWGLIPACTPTSGYAGIPSIANVPGDDAPAAAAAVRRLVEADETEMSAIQAANWKLLDEHYTWDRFAAQVIGAIESSESPAMLPESLKKRLSFMFYEASSPYGRLRYGRAWRWLLRIRRLWEHRRSSPTV
jgi:glycosyltransferase involved in cell wall biosynthesis